VTDVPTRSRHQAGFTIVELLIALAIAAMLLTAMTGLINGVFETRDDTASRSAATRDARFAMQRMISAVLGTERLLVPFADNPTTNWREHVREQTVPASPPEGDSTLATAVLAVTLDPMLDIDADGFADGDNDKDGLVEEDLGTDSTTDAAAGVVGIDDDGDGSVDEGGANDDDEDSFTNEDPVNNLDDDGDGALDEDPNFDVNDDGQPGVSGVDDDGDGNIDEGQNDDDDEDGLRGEDWFDPVVFFLSGSTLIERRPNLNPADGTDYTEYPIADYVTHFRVERIPGTGKRSVLVDITLQLTLPDLEPVSLNTRVRVGGGS
jgi:prepilin-type N-terminal cleavage/methylation domain-containing protein